jgi:hypothetical protein
MANDGFATPRGMTLLAMLERELDDIRAVDNRSEFQNGKMLGIVTGVAIIRHPYDYLALADGVWPGRIDDILAASDARIAARKVKP